MKLELRLEPTAILLNDKPINSGRHNKMAKMLGLLLEKEKVYWREFGGTRNSAASYVCELRALLRSTPLDISRWSQSGYYSLVWRKENDAACLTPKRQKDLYSRRWVYDL